MQNPVGSMYGTAYDRMSTNTLHTLLDKTLSIQLSSTTLQTLGCCALNCVPELTMDSYGPKAGSGKFQLRIAMGTSSFTEAALSGAALGMMFIWEGF